MDKDGNGVDSSETSAGDAETPTYVIDMTGMNINLDKANQGVTFMSYNIPATDIHNKNVYTIHARLTSADNLCSFVYDASSEARHDVAGKDAEKVIPSVGDYVTTDDGLKGEVSSVSVLRQEVKVIVTVNKDEKEIREYKVSQLKFRPHKRKEKTQLSDKELKELEELDKREGRSKLNDK